MKVAIAHDWLTNYGGAETFVELLLKIYPDADIFTLVYDKKKLKGHFEKNRIFTSRMQKLPFASKIYTKLLKFMPRAFEAFDFSGYDLVISSSSACAKGVIVPPHIPHIAYIHSPMRYAWDLFFDYKKRSGALTRFFMERWMPAIREWDYISSQRIDTICANSRYIARRIQKYWARSSIVIYSPVNTNRFFPKADGTDGNSCKGEFYVAFSRLVQYKRVDLAVGALKGSGKKLVVIGSGPELKRLKALAAGDENITFTGSIDDEAVRTYLQNCRALIFCAEEDFGLTPLEAQACGSPVIAFGRGGAYETVVDGKTGVFFPEQSVASLKEALERFEKLDSEGAFKPEEIIRHARTFSESRFIAEFTAAVERTQEKIAGAYKTGTEERV
ncbi:MAG: glycosyltransferase [Treponema sp.]